MEALDQNSQIDNTKQDWRILILEVETSMEHTCRYRASIDIEFKKIKEIYRILRAKRAKYKKRGEKEGKEERKREEKKKKGEKEEKRGIFFFVECVAL